MKNLIQTPYGNKTPELLCRAMDALEREPELMAALEAIEARINGLYDCPALVAFGPLHHDTQWDCLRIAEKAILKAKGEIK
jgi:hypothetical protein